MIDAARELFERALSTAHACHDDSESYILVEIGQLLAINCGMLDKGLDYCRRAIEVARPLADVNPQCAKGLWMALICAGTILISQNATDEAVCMLHEAEKMCVKWKAALETDEM